MRYEIFAMNALKPAIPASVLVMMFQLCILVGSGAYDMLRSDSWTPSAGAPLCLRKDTIRIYTMGAFISTDGTNIEPELQIKNPGTSRGLKHSDQPNQSSSSITRSERPKFARRS